MYIPLWSSKEVRSTRSEAWSQTLKMLALSGDQGRGSQGGVPGLLFERRDSSPVQIGTRLDVYWTSGGLPVEGIVSEWSPSQYLCEATVLTGEGVENRSYRYQVLQRDHDRVTRRLWMKIHIPSNPVAMLRLIVTFPFLLSLPQDAL